MAQAQNTKSGKRKIRFAPVRIYLEPIVRIYKSRNKVRFLDAIASLAVGHDCH